MTALFVSHLWFIGFDSCRLIRETQVKTEFGIPVFIREFTVCNLKFKNQQETHCISHHKTRSLSKDYLKKSQTKIFSRVFVLMSSLEPWFFSMNLRSISVNRISSEDCKEFLEFTALRF